MRGDELIGVYSNLKDTLFPKKYIAMILTDIKTLFIISWKLYQRAAV